MARKLSPITSPKLTILSEITKGKVGKAERQRKRRKKMSFTTIFNIWRWWICVKLPIFASEEKPYRMKTIANILAFVSTYTVIAMVFLIIAQNLVKWLHHTSVLTLEQERTTVIVCLIAAAALIPFFHYPY